LAKFFGKNCQNPIHDGQPLRVELSLRFADEIMNPEITIAFQRTPYLFRDAFEIKYVMKRGLSHD
jgi:hypothetical protein